jgi:beta-ribofuranosylaminobenzene 5'-phosphate synthase
MPNHVGVGSGTQAALSVAAAVNRLYGLGLSVREMAIAVGRVALQVLVSHLLKKVAS